MSLPYEFCKIYGPYKRKRDGRFQIVAIFPGGKKVTVSYPKYLMECHLGRYFNKNETVDHIDLDLQNNEIENLRVMPRIVHVKQDILRNRPRKFRCMVCGNRFSLEGRRLSDAYQNRIKGCRGPFCSRSCAGIASHNIGDYEITAIEMDRIRLKSLIEETQ